MSSTALVRFDACEIEGSLEENARRLGSFFFNSCRERPIRKNAHVSVISMNEEMFIVPRRRCTFIFQPIHFCPQSFAPLAATLRVESRTMENHDGDYNQS